MILKRFVMFTVWAVLAIIQWGCEDKATNNPPVERDYKILINLSIQDANHIDDTYLMIYSESADSVVDSLPFNAMVNDMVFSRDGSKIYLTDLSRSNHQTWIMNWPPTDTVASYKPPPGPYLCLSEDEQYLLSYGYYPAVFSLPGLNLLYIDSTASHNAAFIPDTTLFCFSRWPDDSLYFVDYGIDPPESFSVPITSVSGEKLAIASFCTSKSGDSLILSVSHDNNGIPKDYIAIFGIRDMEVIDQVPVNTLFLQCRPFLIPDGGKVIWYYPGVPIYPPISGEIYSYDITNKDLHLLLDESMAGMFYIYDIEISVGGDYIYILDYGKLMKLRLSDNQVSIPFVRPGETQVMALYPVPEA